METEMVTKNKEKQDKFEFLILPKNVCQDIRLTKGLLLVYGYLLYRQGENDFCYPGHRRIARDLHLNKATVWRSIEQLEKLGWITTLPDKRGRRLLYCSCISNTI